MDHTPIVATTSTHILTRQQSPKLYNRNTNWEALRIHIEENLRLNISLKKEQDIDEAIKNSIT
jgi:hypothetical protein